MNGNVAAHKMVRSVALGIAQEVYADLMKGNVRYKQWRSQVPELNPAESEKVWCQHAWPCFIDVARATLARMLKGDYPTSLKDEILDALVKDATLRPKGASVKTVLLN